MKNLTTLLLACAFSILGSINIASADEKNAFVWDMTHAYYAAYELCPDTKINFAGLLAAGEKAGWDKEGVIDIENALRRINGNTDADIPPASTRKTVEVAATSITVELNRKPKEAWCDFRVPVLTQQGILEPSN